MWASKRKRRKQRSMARTRYVIERRRFPKPWGIAGGPRAGNRSMRSPQSRLASRGRVLEWTLAMELPRFLFWITLSSFFNASTAGR